LEGKKEGRRRREGDVEIADGSGGKGFGRELTSS